MDPNQPYAKNEPIPLPQISGSFGLGSFLIIDDGKDYLASLDSDTREYVIRNTNESPTRREIVDCLNKLHHG